MGPVKPGAGNSTSSSASRVRSKACALDDADPVLLDHHLLPIPDLQSIDAFTHISAFHPTSSLIMSLSTHNTLFTSLSIVLYLFHSDDAIRDDAPRWMTCTCAVYL